MSLESACRNPVQTVLSGPAGGVSGASFVASHAGFDRILTFDMGGTSTDVAVCVVRPAGDHARDERRRLPRARPGGRRREHRRRRRLDRLRRRGDRRAPGRPARAPAPLPGPACYGRGGTAATVTDANVVLGHLPPRLLGGEFELDVDAAHAAVARVAEARGAGVEETARAIVEHGRRGDARRAPRRHRAARPRAERVRARRLRRRRRPARERARDDPRLLPGDRAGGVRRALGARLHLVRDQERVQPDVREEHRGDDAGRRPRAVRGARRPARATGSTRRASTSPTRTSASSSTCATAARATRSRSSWTASSSPRSTSRRSSGGSARRTAASTASCSRAAPRS